ncbi:uncharacterized protein [Atheta coriaria]|uniref:uncharacterized protein n=1 Tax=Dalotia coriaria TaxID=877792 RepID=UPI0031F42735
MAMYIFLICFLVGLGLNTADAACDFKCLDEKEVQYNGLSLTCGKINGDPTVCNEKFCDDDSNGRLCDTIKNMCDYKCVSGDGNENKIILGGEYSECPANTICNTKEDSCKNMCVEKCTNTDKYICLDDKTFVIMGVTKTCGDDQVCNKYYEFPCKICIPSTGNTNKPTEPSKPTTKEVTTPTTTGTTSFPIPDCNNPSGSMGPCRYGPTGYYYKCVKINSSSYAARLISCSAWPDDNICNRYRLC